MLDIAKTVMISAALTVGAMAATATAATAIYPWEQVRHVLFGG